jgi:hypothetical protein
MNPGTLPFPVDSSEPPAVGGNKTKAAAILGIERSTLDRKMARWAKG